MPHINHRRGDTRRRAKQCSRSYMTNRGEWNRDASQAFRAATRQVLRKLRAWGYDVDLCGDEVFPLADEIDNIWNHD